MRMFSLGRRITTQASGCTTFRDMVGQLQVFWLCWWEADAGKQKQKKYWYGDVDRPTSGTAPAMHNVYKTRQLMW